MVYRTAASPNFHSACSTPVAAPFPPLPNLLQRPQLILFPPVSVPSILSGSCEISYSNSLSANHRSQPRLNVWPTLVSSQFRGECCCPDRSSGLTDARLVKHVQSNFRNAVWTKANDVWQTERREAIRWEEFDPLCFSAGMWYAVREMANMSRSVRRWLVADVSANQRRLFSKHMKMQVR